jgi:hypothetical protein
MADVDRIKRLRALRASRAADIEALDGEISDLIRQALQEGVAAAELAKELGVTRARIYQIRGR